jgi:hypothetical protein
MRSVQPLADIDSRAPEAGRIRLGIKTSKAMKSLDTFRFTSPYKDCITALAEMYGGDVAPWTDPKASPSSQWEVVTKASEIEVFLPPNPVSTWYELYAGSGLQRRCDGVTCAIPQQTGPGQWEPVDTPCICAAKSNMECSPHTRLKVLLPNVPFRGIWRLETKGWNALKELPGMAELIRQLNESGSMVRVALGIEKRTQMRPSGKRNFVTPTLTMLDTPLEIMTGKATIASIASTTAPAKALPSVSLGKGEAEVVDAELVVDDPIEEELRTLVFGCAKYFEINEYQLWSGILIQIGAKEGQLTSDQQERIRSAVTRMKNGDIAPIGFNTDQTPMWRK